MDVDVVQLVRSLPRCRIKVFRLFIPSGFFGVFASDSPTTIALGSSLLAFLRLRHMPEGAFTYPREDSRRTRSALVSYRYRSAPSALNPCVGQYSAYELRGVECGLGVAHSGDEAITRWGGERARDAGGAEGGCTGACGRRTYRFLRFLS
ncbi:hypothetical protein C8R45DRAFT_1104013 [Mycena sanguinolenta]|nr:hypothetical protein C8R45DRAFT_1104013 [Mycena sanguinolenta]